MDNSDIKSIYVRYAVKYREVEFADSRDMIMGRSGIVRRFDGNKKHEVINYVLKKWSQYTTDEIEKWKAPEWLKDIYRKVNTRNKVYVTLDDNGDILLSFSINSRIMRISKSPLFFKVYDVYQYIYDTILFIAKNSGFTCLEIYTDLVELLRLNRLYWTDLDKVDLYVSISRQDFLIGGK